MRKLRLVFDLDSIIADLLNPWLEWYNRNWDDNVTIADLHSYHINKHVKPGCGDNIYRFFDPPGRYGNIPAMPGAKEGLAYLRDQGHDIIVCTATAGETTKEKYAVVKKAAPWFEKRNLFVGSRKEVLKSDVFIDDSPDNVRAYRKEWPEAKIATIAFPYNQEIRDVVDCFALDWADTEVAWDCIVQFIDKVADQ